MTLNLDAFTAHVEFTLSLDPLITREATFLETVCFHLVDDAMTGSIGVTTSIFTPANPDEITLDGADVELSDATWDKIDLIMATFLNGGGKRAMFLITTSDLEVPYAYQRELDYKALSIASEVDISKFETTMTEKVLLFPTSDKGYVNTLKQSYVFYISDETAGLSGDFLSFLTMLFSKTGDAFFDRKIMFNQTKMIAPSNALVYKEDILALHGQKVSSYELIDSPDTGRVSNFATSIDNGMGIYQRYRVKTSCEQSLDLLMQRYDFKYNARTMREGVSGMKGGYANCLLRIHGTLHKILDSYANRDVIRPDYFIYIPDQSLEDYNRQYITGIQVAFNPYPNVFRIAGTFTDSIDIGGVTISGLTQGQQAVFTRGKLDQKKLIGNAI